MDIDLAITVVEMSAILPTATRVAGGIGPAPVNGKSVIVNEVVDIVSADLVPVKDMDESVLRNVWNDHARDHHVQIAVDRR